MAREINTYKRDDLFVATPPVEALRMIMSMTATASKGEISMVNDISRAFFHARVIRDVYVQLPNEDTNPGEEQMCGKLNFSMCVTRRVATNWQTHYTQILIQNGFVTGIGK